LDQHFCEARHKCRGWRKGDSGFFIDLGKGGGLGYRFERRKSCSANRWDIVGPAVKRPKFKHKTDELWSHKRQKSRGRTLQEPPASDRADEFPVAHGDFASDGDDRRPALNGPAFEGVVVDVHEMRRGREPAAVAGIVDDKVGVAAGLYCAFSWKKLEDLRRIGAGDVHECVEVEPSRSHAIGVEKIDSILQGRNPVRDFREVVPAHRFLSRQIKRRMVRSNGIDKSLSQAVPKQLLISLFAQRRRHYVLGTFKIGEFRVRLVEQQILDERLHPHPDATQACADGFFERFAAA
jgi:hypothetical protein